jgi:hypothetical protein
MIGKLHKKGQALQQLGALAVGVAGLAIALVVAFLIMSQGKSQIGGIEGIDTSNSTQCQTSIACNSTSVLQEATQTIPPWVPLIIIAVIGGILLGLVKFFKGR